MYLPKPLSRKFDNSENGRSPGLPVYNLPAYAVVFEVLYNPPKANGLQLRVQLRFLTEFPFKKRSL